MPVCAQQLSLRRYDTSDGLAHGMVTSIYQDAKGYLWFSTFEGLSRFDGYRFTNYDTRDGLRHPIVNDVREDRQGRLWVATNGSGVARLVDEPPSDTAGHAAAPHTGSNKFISFPVGDTPASNSINRMLFDSQNNLWCATDGGLYRAALTDTDLKFAAIAPGKVTNAYAAVEDRGGKLWFGVQNELIEARQNQIINHGPVGGANNGAITGIIEDRQGRLLVASGRVLFEFVPPTAAWPRGQSRQLPLTLKPEQYIETMLEDATGVLWLGTNAGLIKYEDGRQTLFTTAQGLSLNAVRSLAEDSDGNLWVGTYGGGACKLSGELIVNYTQAEGLPKPSVDSVFEDRAGRIKALLADVDVSIYYSSIAEIGPHKIRLSQQLDDPPISSESFRIEHDHQGRWWWARPTGSWVRLRQPVVRLRRGRDLALADFFPTGVADTFVHFYEDETGKLWVSKGDGQLYRADATRLGRLSFESFPTDFPLLAPGPLMISDRAGGLWLGNRSRLGRLWQGKFAPIETSDGLPEIDPRSFFMDSRGWFWIGLRYQGVSMTKEPSSEHPTFVNYSTAQGLSSDAVWSVAEDDFGRMYFGTGKGLDEFNPNTNQWRHYTTKDGLAGDKITHLYKDHSGNIWVATVRGVSRFDPRAERNSTRPAPIYLSRVNIAGEDVRLPETGAAQMPRLELAAARNNLEIEFVALSFQGEDNLAYQYRLEGVDADWGAPTKSRFVNYARLAPGAYRFLVRAINKEGEPSPNPALFQFRILPPLYQRWWFILLAAIVILAAAYALFRYRVNRLLELERVRTRIAVDLHDDIGSNLSQIAIWSDVAQRQAADGGGQRPPAPVAYTPEILERIAATARETASAMSDIVWAINPRRDYLSDLISRMRRFAGEAFDSRNIVWALDAPQMNLSLSAVTRREVFLIFKEGVNNIVRHAHCARVETSLTIEGSRLRLRIRDDGRGFDPHLQSEGNGLDSMRERAQKIGGVLEIESAPGSGTTVELKMPLNQYRWRRRRRDD